MTEPTPKLESTKATTASTAADGLTTQWPVTIITMVGPVAASTLLPASTSTVTKSTTGPVEQPTTILETVNIPARLSTYMSSSTVVITDSAQWQPARIMTLTDGFGRQTGTATSLPPGALWTGTTVGGLATTKVPISTVVTIHDGSGSAVATVTEYLSFPLSGAMSSRVRLISLADYVIGTFLPVLVAVLVSIWIQAIDKNFKLLVPFWALANSSVLPSSPSSNPAAGSKASDSLCLASGGISARLHSLRLLKKKHESLPFAVDLLTACSALLVATAGEAVGIKLHGACTDNDFNGCSMSLAVFPHAARTTIALLIFMAVVLLWLILKMARFRSGVAVPPWSIGNMAALVAGGPDSGREVREAMKSLRTGMARRGMMETKQLAEHLAGYTFLLRSSDGQRRYGIAIAQSPAAEMRDWAAGGGGGSAEEDSEGTPDESKEKMAWPGRMRRVPMLKTSAAFLAAACGLIAVIVYYNETVLDTPFESFMDSQHFGVRFLFTGLGVAITFFWDSFYARVATLDPFRQLSKNPQLAKDCILKAPAASPFVGIVRNLRQGDVFGFAVSSAAILAQFIPILLSNVPFRVTQTYLTHKITAWLTVGILGYMAVVILFSFAIRWAYMPILPDTVAGMIYYVCDSFMLLELERVSTLGVADLNRAVEEGNGAKTRYRFGSIFGMSGATRIGVDYARDSLSLHKEFVVD